MRSRGGPLAFLDQIRERLFHEHLQLATFLVGKAAQGREDLGIDLGGEFLADDGNGVFLLPFRVS
jgi:hypothetical protein